MDLELPLFILCLGVNNPETFGVLARCFLMYLNSLQSPFQNLSLVNVFTYQLPLIVPRMLLKYSPCLPC